MKRIYACVATTVLLCNVIAIALLVKSNRSDSLFHANIEALARNEIGTDGYVDCWKVDNDNYDPSLYLEIRDCFDCTIKKVSSASNVNQKCMR